MKRTRDVQLITLSPGIENSVQIKPRWPARAVCIDETAWQTLLAVQASLPSHVGLILTRGYEPRASELGKARNSFRRVGIWLFGLLYPGRKDEIPDIFGSNGHDVDGTHIDISIRVHGRRIRLLPLSVFTPSAWQHRRIQKYHAALLTVQIALQEHGFQLHRNPTESLQIHCDLKLA